MLSEHGVTIAPSTYYDARDRAPSKRAVRDEQVTELIRLARTKRFVRRYGARKMWLHLRREGPSRKFLAAGRAAKAAAEGKSSTVHPWAFGHRWLIRPGRAPLWEFRCND
ncbi:hypothetical protein [Cumulibacter manganitolerans]|uniref:hypothetical protein n=1 Tax=Cumulibacter manganitolerans TaxID=1884992 RepID=UPI001296F270|nr:hypothetical protein [Cumulibacter manganitolerans]